VAPAVHRITNIHSIAGVELNPAAQARRQRDAPPPARAGEPITTAGLLDWIFRGREQDGEQRHPRMESQPLLDERGKRPRRSAASDTYRTLCVRLCDGFYFPISFSTIPNRFAIDAKRCEQSCPTRSRLFFHRNPGKSVVEMLDSKGQPYRNLPTAFSHLTRHIADCTCQGNAWDAEALARHRGYG
jgi:hypothetical protein